MKRVSALLALSVFVAQVAQASPVRSIFASQAEGKSGQLTTVVLWPGYGTNLNLIPTGEVVKKAWLDDPSRVAIDFDGCLGQSAGASNGGGEGCGATVIHLRQITGVNFPGLMTSSNASTLLTLIADGSQGKKLYQFKVVLGQGAPQYNTLTIQPDSQGTPYIDVGLRRAPLEDVEKGLTIAESKKLISRRDSAWSKVRNFLAQVRNGESINTAAQVTGANMAIITKLAELGGTPQPIAPVVPLPVPQQPEILPPPVKMEEAKPVVVVPPVIEKPAPKLVIPAVIKVEEPKPVIASLPVVAAKTEKVSVVAPPSLSIAAITPQPAKLNLVAQPSMPQVHAAAVAVKAPEIKSVPVAQPDINIATKPTLAESPSQILAHFQIPMKEGGSITADRLLDVQQRIWNWKKGVYRQKLGKFIATLITAQGTDKDHSIQEAVQQSGLSLNDVQYLAKASQANSATAPSSSVETKTEPLVPAQVTSPKTLAVANLPVSTVEQKVPVIVNQEPVAANVDKLAVPAGSTTDTLFKLRIPLKDGGSVRAEQLLTVQERIWNWKGGSVRKQLGRFIAVLTASASQGNEQAIQIAVKESGLSLNEVQYLLSKISSPTISSKE
jgi:hypothetical protein